MWYTDYKCSMKVFTGDLMRDPRGFHANADFKGGGLPAWRV